MQREQNYMTHPTIHLLVISLKNNHISQLQEVENSEPTRLFYGASVSLSKKTTKNAHFIGKSKPGNYCQAYFFPF